MKATLWVVAWTIAAFTALLNASEISYAPLPRIVKDAAWIIKGNTELKNFDDFDVFKHKDRLLGRVHITVAPKQGMGIDMEFLDGKWWITAR